MGMDNTNEMTAIILYISHVAFLCWIANKYGRDLIDGLKGENNKWDVPEIIIGLWLILFIMILLANLFLDFEVSNSIWVSMESTLLFALSGKIGLAHQKKNK